MANEVTLNIIGNLTDDPELRQTNSGKSVANFVIASTPRTYNRDTHQWEDGNPYFQRCTAWGALADNIAKSLTKGTRVIARGRLAQREYTDSQGVTRRPTELTIDDIGPSLRYATASVTKAQKNAAVQGNSGSAWNRGQNYSANKPKANSYASSKNYSNGAGFGGDADPLGTGDKPAF